MSDPPKFDLLGLPIAARERLFAFLRNTYFLRNPLAAQHHQELSSAIHGTSGAHIKSPRNGHNARKLRVDGNLGKRMPIKLTNVQSVYLLNTIMSSLPSDEYEREKTRMQIARPDFQHQRGLQDASPTCLVSHKVSRLVQNVSVTPGGIKSGGGVKLSRKDLKSPSKTVRNLLQKLPILVNS